MSRRDSTIKHRSGYEAPDEKSFREYEQQERAASKKSGAKAHKSSGRGAKQARPARSRKGAGRRVVDALLAVVVVGALVAAGFLVWQSMQPPESVEAPLPESLFSDLQVDPNAVTGPAEEAVLPDGTTMTPEQMEPGSMLIPALGVYTVVEQAEEFVGTKYQGFTGLKIPKDPQRSSWYSGGAPLYGSDFGATLIASHVTGQGEWGVLRYLYTLTGGEMIYTKDYDGNVQSWQVTDMRTEYHTDFPQEYWSPEGERYLVVTTCGGSLTSWGTYQYNIFVIARPVDPKPRTAEQIALEKVLAALPTQAVQWQEASQTLPELPDAHSAPDTVPAP